MPETRTPVHVQKRSLPIRLGLSAVIVLGSIFLLIFPLYLWRITYPLTDWAAIFLVALAFMLYAGICRPRKRLLNAWFKVAVREDSWVAKFATGGIRARIYSLIFVAVAIPILACQAMAATDAITPVLVLLCVVSSSMALGLEFWLKHHLNYEVTESWSFALSAGVVATVFIPILAWINWNHTLFPGEFRSLEISEAIQFSVAEYLPPRRGWIAEILVVPIAIESALLWFTVEYGRAWGWVPVVYSIYLGFVAFVMARASTSLASFARFSLRKRRDEPTTT